MPEINATLRGGVVFLDPLPPETVDAVKYATSFKPKGVEYTWAYKNKNRTEYDGRIKLLKNSKCPPGLLPRVSDALAKYGYTLAITDADEHVRKAEIVTTVLPTLKSRGYQDEAVAVAALYDRGIFRSPTGSGKTAIGLRIVALKGLAAVVIVPTIDLLYQYKSFLEAHLAYQTRLLQMGEARLTGEPAVVTRARIGQLGDGVIDPQGITVATIRTMAKVLGVAYESYEYAEYDDKDDTDVTSGELREWVEGLGTVIVDEAHILGASAVYDVVNAIPAPNKYGMSASPWRDDGADLMIEAATGAVIYRIETHRLVQEGYLVPLVVEVIPTGAYWKAAAWGKICKKCKRQWVKPPPRKKGQRNTKCECGSTEFKSQFTECYRTEIVENVSRHALIMRKVSELDRPTFVLVKQVKHGQQLQKLIPGSVFLSGKEKGDVREKAFNAMRAGELQIIVATTIADMGMDVPNLGAIVLAGGGKSSTRHLQRIGRVVRPAPGKDCGIVIDFDDSHVAGWFDQHAKERRKIEKAEWADDAVWI